MVKVGDKCSYQRLVIQGATQRHEPQGRADKSRPGSSPATCRVSHAALGTGLGKGAQTASATANDLSEGTPNFVVAPEMLGFGLPSPFLPKSGVFRMI